MSSIRIRPHTPADTAACEAILRSLPEWFGIEEALRGYVADIAAMETWIAERDGEISGFVTIRRHNHWSAEIQVMAVRRESHGRGIGRLLVRHVEGELRSEGCEFLQVKTLGPSRPNGEYAGTRAFYNRMGFRPLEENQLWGPVNPCLILVKSLRAGPAD